MPTFSLLKLWNNLFAKVFPRHNFALCRLRMIKLLRWLQEGSILHMLLQKYLIATSYTSRLVLHHNGSSVNHIVYLQYGFMATSELDLEFDWVKNWWITFVSPRSCQSFSPPIFCTIRYNTYNMELYTLFGLLNLSEILHIILFWIITYLSGLLPLYCKFLIVSPVVDKPL